MRGLLEERQASDPGIVLDPPSQGTWTWQDRSTLVFSTDEGWPGRHISVEVPDTFKASDGARISAAARAELDLPFELEVCGELPYTTEFSPSCLRSDAENRLWLTSHVNLSFTDQIDPETRSEVKLFERTSQGERPIEARVEERDGKLDVSSAALRVGGRYTLKIGAALRSAHGARLGRSVELRFVVPPALTAHLGCFRDAQRACVSPELSLQFTSPVRLADAVRALQIDPPVGLTPEEHPEDPDERLTTFHFRGTFQPGKTYRLRMPRGAVRDRSGRSLDQALDATLTFRHEESEASRESFWVEDAQGRDPIVQFRTTPGRAVWMAVARLEEEALWDEWEERALRSDASRWEQRHEKLVQVTAGPDGLARLPVVRLLRGRRGTFLLGAQRSPGGEPEVMRESFSPLWSSLHPDPGSALVWVTDHDLRPQAGVTLAGRIKRQEGPPLLPQATTGDDGVATFSWSSGQFDRLAMVRRQGDDAVMLGRDSLFDENSPERDYGGLFPERAVYTAADTIHLRGLLRPIAPNPVGRHAGRTVTIALTRNRHDLAEPLSTTARIDTHGFFQADLRLPTTLAPGQLGDYLAEARIEGFSPRFRLASQVIQLREFRKPESKLSVSLDRESYVAGDPLRCQLQLSYQDGTSARDSAAQAQLSFLPRRVSMVLSSPHLTGEHPFEVDDQPSRDTPDEDTRREAEPRTLSLRDGKGEIREQLGPRQQPAAVVCTSGALDATRTIDRQMADAVVHPADVYPAVRVTPGDPARVEVLALSTDGRATAGVEAQVRVEHLSRTKGGRWEGTEVARCAVSTKREPVPCAVPSPRRGPHRLTVTTRDGRDRRITLVREVESLRPTLAPKSDASLHKPNLPELHLDEPERGVRAGETSTVTIENEVGATQALLWLTYPGEPGARWHRVVKLAPQRTRVEVPMPSDLPAHAMLLLEARRPAATRSDERTWNNHLWLTHEQATPRPALRVQVRPAVATTMPGGEVDIAVDVRAPDGRPVPSEVTLYAVDEGVVQLGLWQQPSTARMVSASEWFQRDSEALGYGPRDWQWEGARFLVRQSSSGSSHLEQPASTSVSALAGWQLPAATRRDLALTPCYHAALPTDATGQARATCRLSDALSSFRIVAVALARDEARGGTGSAHVKTVKPLAVRLGVPPVVRVGDQVEIAVALAASDAQARSAVVRLSTAGALAGTMEPTAAQLDAGAQKVWTPTLTATHVGRGTVRVDVAGQGASDAVELPVEVLPPAGLEETAQQGEIRGPLRLRVPDHARMRPDVGGLTVAAGPLLAPLYGGMEQLLEYPYGCTEQLVSRLVPLLVVLDLGRAVGAPLPSDLDASATEAVGRLLAHRQPEGSFGFWPGDQADPWLTVYAFWGLHEARQRGITVPDELFARVHYAVASVALADFSQHPDATVFAQSVLAQADVSLAPYVEHAFAQRSQLSLSGLALLLRSLTLHGLSGPAAILSQELDAAFGPTGLVGYAPTSDLFDTETRALALLLLARLAQDPHHPQVAPLARTLLATRRGGRWGSTHEAAWALRALDEFRRKRPEDGEAGELTVQLGTPGHTGSEERQLRWGGGADASALRLDAETLGKASGELTLLPARPTFYEARWRYAPREQPTQPRDEGVLVQRGIEPWEDHLHGSLQLDHRLTPVEGVTLGGQALVSVVFEAHTALDQVVIEAPIPAGLTLTDRHAEATFLLSHQERRHDRLLAFASRVPAGLHRLSFRATAAFAGSFQLPPARVEAMYGPERGISAGGQFTVRAPLRARYRASAAW